MYESRSWCFGLRLRPDVAWAGEPGTATFHANKYRDAGELRAQPASNCAACGKGRRRCPLVAPSATPPAHRVAWQQVVNVRVWPSPGGGDALEKTDGDGDDDDNDDDWGTAGCVSEETIARSDDAQGSCLCVHVGFFVFLLAEFTRFLQSKEPTNRSTNQPTNQPIKQPTFVGVAWTVSGNPGSSAYMVGLVRDDRVRHLKNTAKDCDSLDFALSVDVVGTAMTAAIHEGSCAPLPRYGGPADRTHNPPLVFPIAAGDVLAVLVRGEDEPEVTYRRNGAVLHTTSAAAKISALFPLRIAAVLKVTQGDALVEAVQRVRRSARAHPAGAGLVDLTRLAGVSAAVGHGVDDKGGRPGFLVDGIVMSVADSTVTSSACGASHTGCTTHVTVDLGTVQVVSRVTLWQYNDDNDGTTAQSPGSYRRIKHSGTKVALSVTGHFTGEESVVYQNKLPRASHPLEDDEWGPELTAARPSESVAFHPQYARYARWWSGSPSLSGDGAEDASSSPSPSPTHFVEIALHGRRTRRPRDPDDAPEPGGDGGNGGNGSDAGDAGDVRYTRYAGRTCGADDGSENTVLFAGPAAGRAECRRRCSAHAPCASFEFWPERWTDRRTDEWMDG